MFPTLALASSRSGPPKRPPGRSVPRAPSARSETSASPMPCSDPSFRAAESQGQFGLTV